MKVLFINLLIWLSSAVIAQTNVRSINDILNQPERKVTTYRIANSYLEVAVVNMVFGESTVLSIMNKSELKNAEIVQIDLVYTDFPKSINMRDLNNLRIKRAIEIRADLVKNENITWRLVRQMACKSEAEAKLLFHGVVIYYVAPQGKSLSDKEFNEYNNLPKNDAVKITENDLKQFKDSAVVATFRRNKQWKNTTIVSDVTCSMYPYIAQTAFWFLLKMNKKEKTNIVFFNDGDGKSNELKKIGLTGGIYHKSTSLYTDYRDLLLEAVSKGCSGDYEENDVEAILKAQELFPKSTEIILIADNYSDMRDYSLISNIKIPVRVILCGSAFGTNVQYLNLARMTGGSVHTMEEDLGDLIKKVEGEKFTFSGKVYIIKDGKIILFEKPISNM